MISRRNSGVLVFKSWIIFVWILVWFGVNLFVGAEIVGKVSYSQTNHMVYFLGIVLALLIRFGIKDGEAPLTSASRRWIGAFGSANRDSVVLLVILFAIIFATKDKGISRVFLSTYLASLWPTLIILHRYLPDLLTIFLFGRAQRFQTLVIGSVAKANRLSSFFSELPNAGLEVIGVVTIKEETDHSDEFPVLGSLEQLEKIIETRDVDQVIILESEKSRSWFNDVFAICDAYGCHVMVYNFWQEYFSQPVHFTQHGAHTFFMFHDEPLQNPVNRVLKRLLDIAISLPVVVFVIPPMCIWVKLMQAKQSPGPLFYRQYRSGLQKERFRIFKFRSMRVAKAKDSEADQATKGDDRIFSFGAFMRRRSIDEFPQFINILKGDMSVVGPRPHLIDHDKLFSETVGSYRIRHYVKPGLTGLAQVNGFRGEVVDKQSIQKRVEMDIAYINSWSLVLDIELVLRTVSELVSPSDSAY